MTLFIIVMALWVVWMVVWGIFELIFYHTHLSPLTEQEIQSLANKRKRDYVIKTYNFITCECNIDMDFKSSMNPKGQLYRTDKDMKTFPSIVSALLKGKKHEWIVKAIVKDEIVTCFYTNKGDGNLSVSCNLSIQEITSLCKRENGNTIMAFHNHPNSNPNQYTCLLASEQDMISAKYYSDYLSDNGINYVDFVCERGRFIKYYTRIAPTFYPINAKIENIKKENGLSNKQNYKLHRELGLLFREHQNIEEYR